MPKLTALWIRLRESLWFVPTIIVVGAVLLGIGMVELSSVVETERLAWSRVFGVGPDGSRSMLSAIAGSMITVAGVTFSITMVAVTQASAQYTSRILRNFMRDRANQAVLGTFVGIFAYCLVVLRTIRAEEDEEFVPSLAVLMGILLALVGIGVLIFFVHHIATTLQASEIIARVTRETTQVVERLFPEPLDEAAEDGSDALPAVPPSAWHPVPSPATGYLQQAEIDGLVGLAARHGMLLRLAQATGEFVIEGAPLAWVARHPGEAAPPDGRAGPEDLDEPVRREIVVGTYRTLDRDPGFGIRQLVDIALKAISPGINDSTTAVMCIDHLGAVLGRLAGRRMERLHRDEQGRVRVATEAEGFEELLRLGVEQIRQHADGNVAVLTRLLDMLGRVAAVTRSAARRRAIAGQIELVHAAAARTVAAEHDLGRLDRLAREALDAARAPASP